MPATHLVPFAIVHTKVTQFYTKNRCAATHRRDMRACWMYHTNTWRPSRWRASNIKRMWVFLVAKANGHKTKTKKKQTKTKQIACLTPRRLWPNRKLCLQVNILWRQRSIRCKTSPNCWSASMCSAIMCNSYRTIRPQFYGTQTICAPTSTSNFRLANVCRATMKYSSVQSERMLPHRDKIIQSNSMWNSKCTSHIWKLW